ncbi:MAG: carboxymuconolactone decarboxylase family protein [Lachnospiraceae bacterium]|nr:carboxymuconolactone decarboxylase family protein [Lachnospiraceae bacterium]
MLQRRLLVMGVAASGGRADLMKILALGALRNSELTESQLQEVSLHLAYYAGWCNAGSVAKGLEDAIAEYKAEQK